ncbi:Hsp20/alpha crystallin family protein [Oligoflexus tunisiensis]|uniref:Hsp20/alpha crystallin family protein n=1 Tax=Oligoflexus tunisiensis TaxID=708132 RepID=UPI00159F132E|nr:Hsp20/alpha crystallin family protein [Oligoflexus tunisiensis]
MTNLPNMWRELDRPFASLGAWRPLLRQLDDVMNEMVSGLPVSTENRTFLPSVDIEETDDHIVMSFDMPGLGKDNIDIEIQGQQLMVSGERKQERRNGEGRSRFSERRYGRFERVVTLPAGVKTDEVEAQYENGVLTVAIPKSAEAKRHKIKIGESRSGLLGKLVGLGSKKDKETIDVKSSHESQPMQSTAAH